MKRAITAGARKGGKRLILPEKRKGAQHFSANLQVDFE